MNAVTEIQSHQIRVAPADADEVRTTAIARCATDGTVVEVAFVPDAHLEVGDDGLARTFTLKNKGRGFEDKVIATATVASRTRGGTSVVLTLTDEVWKREVRKGDVLLWESGAEGDTLADVGGLACVDIERN